MSHPRDALGRFLPETSLRSTVRNIIRDAVAVLFALAILSVFVAKITGAVPVSLSANEEAMVDFFMFVGTTAALFIVFGDRAMASAISLWDTYRQAKNGGE